MWVVTRILDDMLPQKPLSGAVQARAGSMLSIDDDIRLSTIGVATLALLLLGAAVGLSGLAALRRDRRRGDRPRMDSARFPEWA